MHAIEGFDDRADLDVEPGFFLDLAARRVGERFAELEQAARQRPLAFARLVRALDDQRLAVAHHDGADADDRMRGVFSGHMKSHTEYLTFNIPARMGFENITPQVDAAVRKSGVKEGLVLVNAMHITASVFINDDESGLHKDYAKWLETLAPFDASPERYAHNRTGEDNADAHMKRQIMGREVVVAITKGTARLRPVGADLLRRVRRQAKQARADQSDRRLTYGHEATEHRATKTLAGLASRKHSLCLRVSVARRVRAAAMPPR